MRRSALLSIAVALLLLFAQSAATLHGFAHLTEANTGSGQPDKQLPHTAVCEQCLAAAALDSGMPATAPVFVAVTFHPPVITHSPISFRPRPVPAYSSRAPPRFV